MLPRFFKLHAINKSGQAIDCSAAGVIKVTACGRKIVDGQPVYGKERNFFEASTNVGNGSHEAGPTHNNADMSLIGADGMVEVTPTHASSSGDVLIVYEWATDDAGATFPSGAAGFDVEELDVLCVVPVSGTNTKRKPFRFPE